MSLPIQDRQIREAYQAQRRAEKLKHFKDDQTATRLRLKRAHVSSGHSYEIYEKQTIRLNKLDHSLDVITNQNLTHDTTLLFHCNGASVKSLLWMGLLNPQALTSKVIKALGKYNKKVAERAIKSRIKSSLHAEKAILRAGAQNRIKALQDVELHLGQRIYPDTAMQAAESMIKDLEAYREQQSLSDKDLRLIQALESGTYNGPPWKAKFHIERLRSLKEAYQENKEAALRLQKLIYANQKNAEWLQITGNQEILAFLEERSNSTVREMQGMSQILTHLHGSKAYLRGDLNSFAEDAVKIIRDHVQDFHTPVSRDHQLRYAADQKVTVDSDFHTNGSMSECEDLMLGISVVAGKNDTLRQFRGPVKKTSAVKWRHWHAYYDFVNPYLISIFSNWKRLGAWLWDVILSPFNLVETAIRGNKAEFFQSLRIRSPETTKELEGKTDYYALSAHLNRETSVSTKIGLEIYKAVNYLFVQGLLKGLTDSWKQIKRLSDDLRGDFQNSQAPLKEVVEELRQSLTAINHHDDELLGCDLLLVSLNETQQRKRACAELKQQHPGTPILVKQCERYYLWGNKDGKWNELIMTACDQRLLEILPFSSKLGEGKRIRRGSYLLQPALNQAIQKGHDLSFHSEPATMAPSQPAQSEEKKEAQPRAEPIDYAQPEVMLKPYASHGVLNGGVDGYVEFVDLFGHHLFAKHPFTATVSTAGAFASFLAFLTPALAIQLLGKGYVKFLQDQGFLWTKDVFSASLAGSFTNFKLIAAILEGVEHGPDSWGSRIVSQVINDPIRVVAYTTFSWLIGHTLVFWLEVPGVSAELRAHIGDPAAFSEIFGGAKMGLIGYQLFVNPHADPVAARRDYINQCLKNYRLSQKKRGLTLTAEKEASIKDCLERLLSPENKHRIREAIKIAREKNAPKTQADADADHQLSLMLQLATHQTKLSRLSPELKAKLQYNVRRLAAYEVDAAAINQYFFPERYAPTAMLRNFLGRVLRYVPTLFRCILSPFAWAWTGSWAAAARPWRDLGTMLLDDLTSTTFAVFRFVNKTMESVFNRLPRTVADVLVNSIAARVLSFFGFHQLTRSGYHLSAQFDNAQSRLSAATTGGIMTYLARKNTTPPRELSLSYVLTEKMQQKFESLPKRLSPLPLPVSRGASQEEKPALPQARQSPAIQVP